MVKDTCMSSRECIFRYVILVVGTVYRSCYCILFESLIEPSMGLELCPATIVPYSPKRLLSELFDTHAFIKNHKLNVCY